MAWKINSLPYHASCLSRPRTPHPCSQSKAVVLRGCCGVSYLSRASSRIPANRFTLWLSGNCLFSSCRQLYAKNNNNSEYGDVSMCVKQQNTIYKVNKSKAKMLASKDRLAQNTHCSRASVYSSYTRNSSSAGVLSWTTNSSDFLLLILKERFFSSEFDWQCQVCIIEPWNIIFHGWWNVGFVHFSPTVFKTL